MMWSVELRTSPWPHEGLTFDRVLWLTCCVTVVSSVSCKDNTLNVWIIINNNITPFSVLVGNTKNLLLYTVANVNFFSHLPSPIPVLALYFGLATWVQSTNPASSRPSSVFGANLVLTHRVLSPLPPFAIIYWTETLSISLCVCVVLQINRSGLNHTQQALIYTRNYLLSTYQVRFSQDSSWRQHSESIEVALEWSKEVWWTVLILVGAIACRAA